MRILAPFPTLVSMAASALLFACAAPKPRFEGARKCYILDSTDHVSREDYAAMFRSAAPDAPPADSGVAPAAVPRTDSGAALGAVDSVATAAAPDLGAARTPALPDPNEGMAFAPCDSVREPRLRIRPVKSTVPSMASTGWLLGANAAAAGAGAGLTLALHEGFYLLAPALTLPLAPMSRATYLIEYKDSAGVKHEEVLRAREGAWFNDRAESRREILEVSRGLIAKRLFGLETGERAADAREARLSFEPLELIYYARSEAVIFAPHFEKFLPGNFSMEFSPTLNIPLSGYDGSLSLHVAPRRYFFGRHWGPFLGFGPYGSLGYDENLYSAAGLPAVTGFVWQGLRFSVALEAGGGPVYRWGGPKSDLGWVAIGGINVGASF